MSASNRCTEHGWYASRPCIHCNPCWRCNGTGCAECTPYVVRQAAQDAENLFEDFDKGFEGPLTDADWQPTEGDNDED